jgi:superfamily II DNA/RNA helicase
LPPGRTARIGNRGLATSFYSDRNEDLALDLVKILSETSQTIPDFLQSYVPEDAADLRFEEDSEAEEVNNIDPNSENVEIYKANVPAVPRCLPGMLPGMAARLAATASAQQTTPTAAAPVERAAVLDPIDTNVPRASAESKGKGKEIASPTVHVTAPSVVDVNTTVANDDDDDDGW